MTLLIYILLFFAACGFTHLFFGPLNWGGVGGCAIALSLTWLIPVLRAHGKIKRLPKDQPEVPKALILPNTFYDAATGMLHVTKGTPELPEGSTIQLTTPNPADAYRTPPGLPTKPRTETDLKIRVYQDRATAEKALQAAKSLDLEAISVSVRNKAEKASALAVLLNPGNEADVERQALGLMDVPESELDSLLKKMGNWK